MARANSVRVNFMIPRDLYENLKALIPARKRSKMVAGLIEKELVQREKELVEAAHSVEQDEELNQEMKDWEITVDDGLNGEEWKS